MLYKVIWNINNLPSNCAVTHREALSFSHAVQKQYINWCKYSVRLLLVCRYKKKLFDKWNMLLTNAVHVHGNSLSELAKVGFFFYFEVWFNFGGWLKVKLTYTNLKVKEDGSINSITFMLLFPAIWYSTQICKFCIYKLTWWWFSWWKIIFNLCILGNIKV